MEMRPNRVKHKLANGELALIIAGITDSDDIDVFGPNGFDGVWLEGEHGAVDAAEVGDLSRVCDLWGMTSIVRVNRNDQALIYRTFDRGAQAVCVPHVNTRAEAENVVQGGKFAPIGQRGMFTSRQGLGVDNYFARANDETALIILIEDINAVENLDEILKVDHIDAFFVAPADFAASMGHINEIGHPDVQAQVDDALKRIIAAGRTAGTYTTTASVARFVAAGVNLVMVTAAPWLAAGAAEYKRTAEGAR
jgi:4-hydroxy-2-oxoheptanedioate aldolase